VATKLEIGNPAIALSDATNRTCFRELSCRLATLWGRHYLGLFYKHTNEVFRFQTKNITGALRKLHNEELYNLKSSPNIINTIKVKRDKVGWHAAHM
jgi:hypothetical protein